MLLTAAATYPMLGWESDRVAFTVLGTVMHTGTVCQQRDRQYIQNHCIRVVKLQPQCESETVEDICK